MKRNTIFFLCLAMILSLAGCSKSSDNFAARSVTMIDTSSVQPTSAKDNNEYRLNEAEIRKNYKENEIKSVNKIGSDYLLVEWQEEGSCNMFNLYNLKTGKVDLLPTIPQFTKLEKVENENCFIFKALGKSHVDGFKTFPYYIKCFRIKNSGNQNETFISVREDRYYDIDETVEAGAKDECLMSDLNVTFDGLEVMFKPIKGKEGYFYAASTYIPSVKTSFNKESNKLTIIIGAEDIGSNLSYNKSIVAKDNPYFSSYQITKEGGKINLVINLKDSAKKYLIRTDKAPVGTAVDGFPFINIKFRGSEY